MSSMVGPWRLATMWGFLRATLPTEVVTMSMYVTLMTLSWTMQVVYTVATVGPINVLGCLVSGGLNRGQRGWIPQQVGHTSLEVWRWCNLGLEGLWWWHRVWLLLHGPLVLFGSLMPGCPSPCFLAAVLPPQLTKSWRGPSGRGHWPGWMQHLSPTGEVTMGCLPLLSLLMPHRGDIWLLSQLTKCGCHSSQFLSGLLFRGCLFHRHLCRDQLFDGLHFLWSGGLPNSSAWIPSGSLVMGVSTGMGAQVCPSSSLSWRAAISRMASLEKATYGAITCLNSWTHSTKRHGQPGIGGLAFSAQYWEGLCIGWSPFRLPLSKVLAGKHWVWKCQEFLLADALGSQWCWVVISDTLGCAHYLGDFKGGPYILGKFLKVIYSWDPHQLLPPVGCVDPEPLPLNPLFMVFHGGLPQEIKPMGLFLHGGWLLQEVLDVQPQLQQDLRSRLPEGCPAAWSSSDVSGSRKVTHQCKPVRLPVGDQAWLPSSGMAPWHIQLCPRDLLLGWSQLWEQWQMSSLVLVVDWLSLSICSFSVVVAARACQWASLASASSHSPYISCISPWEALLQWQDRCILVGSSPPLPPEYSHSSALGGLSRKTKFPSLPLVPAQAHIVGLHATSWVHILDGRGLQFLLWTSGTLPAGWQIPLPQSPALGGPAGDHGELISLLPSAQIQWHVWTSVGG